MKILELNFEKTWRGGERQSYYLMSGLQELDVGVELLCREGFPLHEQSKSLNLLTHNFNNIFQVIAFLIVHGRKYDILHAETAQILTYCVLTKPFHRTKVVYTRRLDFVPRGLLTKMKYAFTDKTIAISTAIKKIVKEFSGKESALIPDIVVPKTLDKGRSLEVLHSLNVDTTKPIVATVAAMVQHKDPLTLVECIKTLKERGVDFQFVHFGDGVLQDVVKEKVKEYALEDVYTFAGFQDNVEDFFSLFNVFIMSSEEEGLGSSVLDAFLYKVPVVSTDAGGLKDLLDNNRGVICNVKKPHELADGIASILNKEADAVEMTKNAHRYVLNSHSRDVIVKEYVATFKEVLGL